MKPHVHWRWHNWRRAWGVQFEAEQTRYYSSALLDLMDRDGTVLGEVDELIIGRASAVVFNREQFLLALAERLS